MVTKKWYIDQIKRHWINHLIVENECRGSLDRRDECKQAHRKYYQFMYGAKEVLGFSYSELSKWLREAEREEGFNRLGRPVS